MSRATDVADEFAQSKFASSTARNVALLDEIERLRRVNAELEQDAARYRWLKLQAKPGEPFDLLQKMREAHALLKAYEVFCTGWAKWDETIDDALTSGDHL